MFPSKVLLQVSGSIACFKAAALASLLVKRGCEVQVVATESALKFVGEATFEGLTSRPVMSDVFERGRMMDHIHLARWAELMILYPASANSLNHLAAGFADDLIGTLALAREPHIPYVIAPAMNQQMWAHPATQASVEKLKSWGLILAEPNAGALACGEVGPGRLVEPEEMMSLLEELFKTPSPLGRVLVTSGGTREPIDSVRFITNMSSGATGASIADELLRAGFEVTYLAAKDAERPANSSKNLRLESFSDFTSLNLQLETLLGEQNYSAVIHAAAVSDYSVDRIEGAGTQAKLESGTELTLKLKPNFKILSRIRSYSKNKALKLVGFKLTAGNDPKDRDFRVAKMQQESAPDFIVHNDLANVSASKHLGTIYQGTKAIKDFSTKKELGRLLAELIVDSKSKAKNFAPTTNEVNL